MTLLRTIMALAVTFGLAAEAAAAYEVDEGSRAGSSVAAEFGDSASRAAPEPTLVAAADCSSAASRAARQTGGQVLSVSTKNQGGQTVCVVTVLVPGKGNERPRKQTVTIRP